MRFFTDADIGAALPWDAPDRGSIEQILDRTRSDRPGPHPAHRARRQRQRCGSFLLKPGWVAGEIIGVKAVTVFPDNGMQDLPMVQAGVLLFDGVDRVAGRRVRGQHPHHPPHGRGVGRGRQAAGASGRPAAPRGGFGRTGADGGAGPRSSYAIVRGDRGLGTRTTAKAEAVGRRGPRCRRRSSRLGRRADLDAGGG